MVYLPLLVKALSIKIRKLYDSYIKLWLGQFGVYCAVLVFGTGKNVETWKRVQKRFNRMISGLEGINYKVGQTGLVLSGTVAQQ